MAFQQACAVQKYVEPALRIKALNGDNFDIISDGNNDALKEYSIRKPFDQKKMVKLIKVQDDQANTLVKRENNKPKLGRSTSSPASIAVESVHHNVPKANKMKTFFKGRNGKIAAGAALATVAAGAITGAIVHHNHKNKQRQQAQQFVEQPEMQERQEEIESFEKPFVKRAKMPKGKGFALLAGGAAIGAVGMHLYSKSGNSPAADPNAAATAAGPPPPPAK